MFYGVGVKRLIRKRLSEKDFAEEGLSKLKGLT